MKSKKEILEEYWRPLPEGWRREGEIYQALMLEIEVDKRDILMDTAILLTSIVGILNELKKEKEESCDS